MKRIFSTVLFVALTTNAMAQAPYSVIDEQRNITISDTVKSPQEFGDNGFNFESFTTGINSEYSSTVHS